VLAQMIDQGLTGHVTMVLPGNSIWDESTSGTV
jgi:hypothetical protein